MSPWPSAALGGRIGVDHAAAGGIGRGGCRVGDRPRRVRPSRVEVGQCTLGRVAVARVGLGCCDFGFGHRGFIGDQRPQPPPGKGWRPGTSSQSAKAPAGINLVSRSIITKTSSRGNLPVRLLSLPSGLLMPRARVQSRPVRREQLQPILQPPLLRAIGKAGDFTGGDQPGNA